MQYRCTVCGFIYEGDLMNDEPEDYLCPLCALGKDVFELVEE